MQSGSSNPAKKFIEWKSSNKSFAYYDKERKENIPIELPFKFLAMVNYKTIKGWNQKREGAIISNEIRNMHEILTVNFYPRTGEKQTIATGKWKEIKESVDLWGGKYTESIYGILPNGELINIQLNGSGLGNWFDFQKGMDDNFYDTWVRVDGFSEGKSGAVTYYSPVFSWGKNITDEEAVLAENADELITNYEASYFDQPEATPDSEVDKYKEGRQPTPPPENDEVLTQLEKDDLPF